MRTRVLVAVCALAIVACKAKLAGHVTLDGASFEPTACRSGQALGFSGVELSDASGRRLRLALNVDGTTTAALFAAGAAKGDNLGACGTLVLQPQDSRINNVQNMEGTAKLSCKGAGHDLSGELEFANCH